ncbi:VOC family protein [Aquamicrobium sp. LC103]|uniref:VOC family protein n=1 Tax=Aquamicrobium sp. LC103 TaxID=1120658 RepID=UPI00063E7D0B|nr:VOC family protein [Aquamicrobium sp. LC103]
MTHPVTGIDHCYLLVNDLDRSLEQFRGLGFTISPRGFHSEKMGSANHTIMFAADDYFELLGIVAPTEENAGKRALLNKDGEGLYAIACRIDDAREARRELAALGIATGEVVDFERPVTLPAGGEAVAAFSILQFDKTEVPLGIAFMCQHRTRDTVWLPELMRHPNGAKGLAGAVAASDDPRAAAKAYARLYRAGQLREVDGGYEVKTGSVPLTFLTREALAGRYEGIDVSRTPTHAFAVLRIAVEDLDRARKAIAVPLHETPRGLATAPAATSGAIVEFIEQ